VDDAPSEFRLTAVDVGAVAVRIDERIREIRGLRRCHELAISRKGARVRRHPDVGGQTAQHAKFARLDEMDHRSGAQIPCAVSRSSASTPSPSAISCIPGWRKINSPKVENGEPRGTLAARTRVPVQPVVFNFQPVLTEFAMSRICQLRSGHAALDSAELREGAERLGNGALNN
jgi:hypothetical protein